MSEPNEAKKGEKPSTPKTDSFGARLAKEAISQIDESRKSSSCGVSGLDVDEFLECCSKNGKDPIDVVSHIASREGIDLLSDRDEQDSERDALKTLLLAVLRKFISETVSMIADQISGGDWKSILQDYINSKFGWDDPKDYDDEEGCCESRGFDSPLGSRILCRLCMMRLR